LYVKCYSNHSFGHSSTMSINEYNGNGQNGLRVLIVGAGIGGLVAAIALRQQGHHVEVGCPWQRNEAVADSEQLFERSRFANEIGAAIHLSPSCNGVLKRLGIDATKFGAVEAEMVCYLHCQVSSLVLIGTAARIHAGGRDGPYHHGQRPCCNVETCKDHWPVIARKQNNHLDSAGSSFTEPISTKG
jgi:hypothetical protein